jgi:hypothetical protein
MDTTFDDEFDDITPTVTSEPVRTSRTGRKPSGTRRPSAKRLNDLQGKLSGQMFQAGTMIGFGLPVTGYYIAQESDNFTNAVIELAAKNSNWIKALEQVADIQPGITVGRVVLGMGVALSVDRHKEALEFRSTRFQRIAAFMGVASAYNAIYGDNSNAATGTSYNPPPQQYQPVS